MPRGRMLVLREGRLLHTRRIAGTYENEAGIVDLMDATGTA